jgi:hypothetical protein
MAVEAPASSATSGSRRHAGPSAPWPTEPEEASADRIRRAAWLRRILIAILVAIVVVGMLGFFGIRTRTAETTANGFNLQVHFASIARPGVEVPFDVSVQRDGGFNGTVTLSVSGSYLSAVDAQSPQPEPQSTTADDDVVTMTFAAPQGDTLGVSWLATIDPAANAGRKQATITVLGDDGSPAASVSIRTWVLP